MNRRELLVGGATLGFGTRSLAAGGEARFDPGAVEAALERIDARMAGLAKVDFSRLAPTSSAEAELQAMQNRVGRAAARTLYFTGAFMELEEHERLHPGVQDRIKRLAPEMDAAVDGVATLLESLTPADHRTLREALRQDPGLAESVGEELQRAAKEDGFGFVRRADLRLAVRDLAARMSVQNPALVIDPPVQKARRIQANPQTDAELERTLAIRAGEKAFWDFQRRSVQAVAQWDRIYAARPSQDLAALDEIYPPPREPTPEEKAEHTINAGLIVMGIGAGSLLLGGIAYLISTAGASGFGYVAAVLGVTIGPLLLIAGLIVLIVGAVMSANAKDARPGSPR